MITGVCFGMREELATLSVQAPYCWRVDMWVFVGEGDSVTDTRVVLSKCTNVSGPDSESGIFEQRMWGIAG